MTSEVREGYLLFLDVKLTTCLILSHSLLSDLILILFREVTIELLYRQQQARARNCYGQGELVRYTWTDLMIRCRASLHLSYSYICIRALETNGV